MLIQIPHTFCALGYFLYSNDVSSFNSSKNKIQQNNYFCSITEVTKSGKDWIDNLFNKFWKFLSWLQYSSNISIPGAKLRHFTVIECFKKSSIFTLATLTVKSVFN